MTIENLPSNDQPQDDIDTSDLLLEIRSMKDKNSLESFDNRLEEELQKLKNKKDWTEEDKKRFDFLLNRWVPENEGDERHPN